MLLEAFEIEHWLHEYFRLTITNPSKGKSQDVKDFHFLSSPKKVNWSLSPPTPPDSSCRVSSPNIGHQLSSKEELPWLPTDHKGGAAMFASILYPLLRQHLAGQGYLLLTPLWLIVRCCCRSCRLLRLQIKSDDFMKQQTLRQYLGNVRL